MTKGKQDAIHCLSTFVGDDVLNRLGVNTERSRKGKSLINIHVIQERHPVNQPPSPGTIQPTINYDHFPSLFVKPSMRMLLEGRLFKPKVLQGPSATW